MRHKRKAKKNPCEFFWGTHGCRKQYGHLGRHLCSPGCSTPDLAIEVGTVFGKHALYGRDLPCPVIYRA